MCHIKVPIKVPPEYDLHLVFVRTSGRSDILFDLVVDDQMIELALGGYNNTIGGLGEIDGKTYAFNSTKIASTIDNDKDYDLVVHVRQKSIRIELDHRQQGFQRRGKWTQFSRRCHVDREISCRPISVASNFSIENGFLLMRHLYLENSNRITTTSCIRSI